MLATAFKTHSEAGGDTLQKILNQVMQPSSMDEWNVDLAGLEVEGLVEKRERSKVA